MRRNNFDICIDIIESLRRTDGLNATRIMAKANVQPDQIDKYLIFLKNENLIDSRPPKQSEAYSSRTEQIYFLRQESYQFMRDLNSFKIKFHVDDIEKQLQAIR